MYRYSALSLIGLLLAGCATCQTPRDDPFFGRTRLPPPPTGAVTGRAADPYYPQGPPVVQMPPGAPAGCAPAPGAPSIAPGLSAAGPPAAPPGTAPPYRYPPPAAAASPPPAAIPAGSASPPGIAPNLLGPRPISTGVPSTPPGGGWTYPVRSAAPAAGPPAATPPPAGPGTAAPPSGSAPVTVSRIGGSFADRNPRPVDDAGASANVAERKPGATLLPPQPNGSGGDVPDITDLPKAR